MISSRGVHPPPEAMMHFSPVSDFPPVSEKCSHSVENFSNVTFSRKKFRFSSAKISDYLCLVIKHKFRISPHIFAISIHFHPPISTKLFFPPLTLQMTLCFRQIYVSFIYFVFFVSPYFYYDAFMHHTMHVLDAPD